MGNVSNPISTGSKESANKASSNISKGLIELHLSTRVEEVFNIVQYLVMDPYENTKWVPIAVTNRIIENVKVILRVYFSAELDNATCGGIRVVNLAPIIAAVSN